MSKIAINNSLTRPAWLSDDLEAYKNMYVTSKRDSTIHRRIKLKDKFVETKGFSSVEEMASFCEV